MKNIFIAFIFFFCSCNQKIKSSNTAGTLSSDKQYYSNGKLKDSIVVLGDHTFKQLSYYETGELKEVGYMKDSLKSGSWREYNKSGTITDIAFYYKDKKLNVAPDKSDYYFKTYHIDSYMILELPEKWKIERGEVAAIIAYKLDSTEPFRPNVNVIKDSLNRLPVLLSNKDSVYNFMLQIIASKCNIVKMLHAEWSNSNFLVLNYVIKDGNGYIYKYDMLVLGRSNYYYINSSCYYGENSEFLRYVDVFREMQYSLELKD